MHFIASLLQIAQDDGNDKVVPGAIAEGTGLGYYTEPDELPHDREREFLGKRIYRITHLASGFLVANVEAEVIAQAYIERAASLVDWTASREGLHQHPNWPSILTLLSQTYGQCRRLPEVQLYYKIQRKIEKHRLHADRFILDEYCWTHPRSRHTGGWGCRICYAEQHLPQYSKIPCTTKGGEGTTCD